MGAIPTIRVSPVALALGVFVAFLAVTPARAVPLLSTSGGTSLTAFADPDDGSLNRAVSGGVTLYGVARASLFVQVNGFLSVTDGSTFANDRSVASLAAGVKSPVVAPLYDDLILTTGGSVLENDTANYYAITYDLNGVDNTSNSAGNRSVAQVALFKNATTVNGTNFNAGDIVFSYGALNHTINGSGFSVGIARDGANATGAFTSSGQFTSAASFFANFDPNTQAVRFRPAGATYTQSTIPLAASVVPEAPSAWCFVLGALAAVAAFFRPLRGGLNRRRVAVEAVLVPVRVRLRGRARRV